MSREVTIKVIVPDGVRILARDIVDHVRKLDPRIAALLLLSISGDGNGPTLEEIKNLMDQRIKELRGQRGSTL